MGTTIYIKVRRLPSGKTRIDLDVQSSEADYGTGTLQVTAKNWELLKASLSQLTAWLANHGASIDLIEVDLTRESNAE